MAVIAIPCLADNYAYLVICEKTRLAAIVDPSESAPVETAIRANGVALAAVLCTHHHPDHVGGVDDLVDARNGSPGVYAHASERERIPRFTNALSHGDRFTVGELTATALHIPGHTLGAVAFVFDHGWVFTGDTLFAAGCGRLFEGTPASMHRSLNTVLGGLTDSCEVYPGHEYAEKNLRFAATVEPENSDTRARLSDVTARRGVGELCVPTTMGVERATNPFLRVGVPAVQDFAVQRGARADDAVAVFAELRRARDVF